MCEPTVFRKTKPIARKAHRCYECNSDINPGNAYAKHSGVWEGQGMDFKLCKSCDDLLEAEFARNPEFYYEYGDLHGAIAEAHS